MSALSDQQALLDTPRSAARSVPRPLALHPVTEAYKTAYFNLIQEQAAQHASTVAHNPRDVDALYGAVGRADGNRAFLVIDSHSGKALAAVTYFAALGMKGAGLYLDDIVTTRAERGRGVGGFALASLAKIALHSGASHIALECAYHNAEAQKFYTDLGAQRFEDRHTWRKLGFSVAADEVARTGLRVRSMRSLDAPRVAALFAAQGGADQDAGLAASIAQGQILSQPDFVFAVAEDARGVVVGAGMAYRNFSSFREVSGLHIARIASDHGRRPVAASLLAHFAKVQRTRGWGGHLDFTIDNHRATAWAPVLQAQGLAPLAYGDDPMVVRCFSGAALEALSRRRAATDKVLAQTPALIVPLRPRSVSLSFNLVPGV